VQWVGIHLDETRRREFRRFLGASAVLHMLAFALLAWMPTLPSIRTPDAIAVSLVASPTPAGARPAAPAKPAEKAAPAPPRPAPKPPKPAPVVLPKEPAAPTPVAKPAPPKPAPPEPAAEPEAPPQQNYTDVLAQLREELGEEAPPEPAPAAAPAVSPGSGTGGGVQVSPEVAAWMRDVRVHMRQNWVLTGNFRMNSLAAQVEVELDASGAVLGEPRLLRSSGNPWYDEGVVRSLRKASPLPAPPEAGAWPFTFVSDEL
jgi:colicin import membrane protein